MMTQVSFSLPGGGTGGEVFHSDCILFSKKYFLKALILCLDHRKEVRL